MTGRSAPADQPSGLPVEASVDEVRSALREAGVAVLQAEPGAGKTTIVPLRLRDEPWLADRRIVVLEPRRLATRAAARRMAALLGDEVGGLVGYRTREERRTSDRTRIEVVTEGVLTRRLQSDPELGGVGLVVFDEFHERNLQGDLGLALTLDVRRSLRPDLRVLVMSATLDGERVAALLGGDGPPAPVITSPGRTFPIEHRWVPRRPKDRLEPAVVATVQQALREEDGDLLVFLPGAGEITRVAGLLADVAVAGIDIRPLFGALPTAEQDAAIAPSPAGRRKVVLSTDIAETSLTVEGVRVVVDAGLSREPRYDPRTGMTRLTTVPASRASADQRAGRAGRLEPGVAYRLWSKLEQAARPRFHEPEIGQVDLAGLALELAAWGVRDASDLPWLDAPPGRTLADARRLLTELGAADADGRITSSGRSMVELPLHPRLAHMVVAARDRGLGWLACLLATLLEERDVLRGRPDDLPADLGERLALLDDPSRRHPSADGRALQRARTQAIDLARRARVEPGSADARSAGKVLAWAYPDRVAQARDGGGGRFRLRSGTGAWVPRTDPLAREGWLVAADLDGDRKEARIRRAAALDEADVLDVLDAQVTEVVTVAWDRSRDDVVCRVERRLDGLRLSVVERRPEPGGRTLDVLLDRIRSSRLAALTWTDRARGIQGRVALCRSHLGDDWPELGDASLLADLAGWLGPFLTGATGRADVEALDVAMALGTRLSFDQQMDLDRLTPRTVTVPAGRAVALDYSTDPPTLAVKVQDMYGTTVHPTVLDGRLPVVLQLLSPADRPIQVTSDLAGFWAGSWREVRKEMAGRYPKHHWPDDPATASPRRPPRQS